MHTPSSSAAPITNCVPGKTWRNGGKGTREEKRVKDMLSEAQGKEEA